MFEKVVKQFTDQFITVEQQLQELFHTTQNKIDKDELESLTANKVSKDELEQIIPNAHAQNAQIKDLVEDAAEDLSIKIAQQLKKIDEKFV